MQRTACWITSLAILGFVLGCDENKKEGMAMDDQGSVAYDYPSSSSGSYDSGSSSAYSDPAPATGADAGYGSADSSGYDSGGGYDSGSASYAAPASTGYSGGGAGGMHTVARGDTLYKLARMYYNDQSKWRTIYEANRGQLSSPHMLRVGQQLVIP